MVYIKNLDFLLVNLLNNNDGSSGLIDNTNDDSSDLIDNTNDSVNDTTIETYFDSLLVNETTLETSLDSNLYTVVVDKDDIKADQIDNLNELNDKFFALLDGNVTLTTENGESVYTVDNVNDLNFMISKLKFGTKIMYNDKAYNVETDESTEISDLPEEAKNGLIDNAINAEGEINISDSTTNTNTTVSATVSDEGETNVTVNENSDSNKISETTKNIISEYENVIVTHTSSNGDQVSLEKVNENITGTVSGLNTPAVTDLIPYLIDGVQDGTSDSVQINSESKSVAISQNDGIIEFNAIADADDAIVSTMAEETIRIEGKLELQTPNSNFNFDSGSNTLEAASNSQPSKGDGVNIGMNELDSMYSTITGALAAADAATGGSAVGINLSIATAVAAAVAAATITEAEVAPVAYQVVSAGESPLLSSSDGAYSSLDNISWSDTYGNYHAISDTASVTLNTTPFDTSLPVSTETVDIDINGYASFTNGEKIRTGSTLVLPTIKVFNMNTLSNNNKVVILEGKINSDLDVSKLNISNADLSSVNITDKGNHEFSAKLVFSSTGTKTIEFSYPGLVVTNRDIEVSTDIMTLGDADTPSIIKETDYTIIIPFSNIVSDANLTAIVTGDNDKINTLTATVDTVNNKVNVNINVNKDAYDSFTFNVELNDTTNTLANNKDYTVSVTNTAPTLNINESADGITMSELDNKTFTLTASDNDNNETLTWYMLKDNVETSLQTVDNYITFSEPNNNEVVMTLNPNTDTVEGNTASLSSNFEIYVKDNNNIISNKVPVNITLTNAIPTITSNALASYTITGNYEIVLDKDYSELDYTLVSSNGFNYNVSYNAGTYLVTLNSEIVEEVTEIVTFTVMVGNNNPATTSINITYNLVPPTLTLNTSADTTAITITELENKTITFTASDNNYTESFIWYMLKDSVETALQTVDNYITFTEPNNDNEVIMTLNPTTDNIELNTSNLTSNFMIYFKDEVGRVSNKVPVNITLTNAIPTITSNNALNIYKTSASYNVVLDKDYSELDYTLVSSNGFDYDVTYNNTTYTYTISLTSEITEIVNETVTFTTMVGTNNPATSEPVTIEYTLVPTSLTFDITERLTKTVALGDVSLVSVDLSIQSIDSYSPNVAYSNNNLEIDLTDIPKDLVDETLTKTSDITLSLTRNNDNVNYVVTMVIFNDNDLDGVRDDDDLDDDNDGIDDVTEKVRFGENAHLDPNLPILFNGGKIEDTNFSNVVFNKSEFTDTLFVNCNFENVEMIDCTFNGSVKFTGRLTNMKLTFNENVNEEYAKNIIKNIDYSTDIYEYTVTDNSIIFQFKIDCLPDFIIKKTNGGVVNNYDNIKEIIDWYYYMKNLEVPTDINNSDFITDVMEINDNTYNLTIGSTTYNGNVVVYSSSNQVSSSTVETNEGILLPVQPDNLTFIGSVDGEYIQDPDSNTSYNSFIFYGSKLEIFVTGYGMLRVLFENGNFYEYDINNNRTFIGTRGDTVILDDKLTLTLGSMIGTEPIKFTNQNVEINLFNQISIDVSEDDLFKMTNLSSKDFVESYEIKSLLGSDTVNISDGTSIINTARITKFGKIFTLTLDKTNECTFTTNVNILLKDIKKLDANNNFVESVITGQLTFIAQYQKTNSVTFGDPHIVTASGKTYELPSKVTTYRLLQGNDFVVNVSTRKLTYEEGLEIKSFYRKVTKRSAPKSLVTNGVVYDRVVIHYKKSILNFSFTKDSLQQIGTEIQLLNKHCARIVDKELGTVTINFNFLSNPQEKYGIAMSCSNIDKLTGLMMKEFIATSMEVKSLLDKQPKEGKLGANKVITIINKFKK